MLLIDKLKMLHIGLIYFNSIGVEYILKKILKIIFFLKKRHIMLNGYLI